MITLQGPDHKILNVAILVLCYACRSYLLFVAGLRLQPLLGKEEEKAIQSGQEESPQPDKHQVILLQW